MMILMGAELCAAALTRSWQRVIHEIVELVVVVTVLPSPDESCCLIRLATDGFEASLDKAIFQ
jgi:hypothetical protein